MSIVAIFLRVAKHVLIDLTVLLILFFLPMDVIFRLSSWLLFVPAMDMVRDVSMMILLLALMSAGLALLLALVSVGMALAVAGVAYSLNRIGWSLPKVAEKIEEAVCAVSAFGTLALIVILFLKTLKTWMVVTTGGTVASSAETLVVSFLVIGILLAVAWEYGLVNTGKVIQSRLARGGKGVLLLIVSAGILVAVHLPNDYREIMPNQTASLRAAGTSNVILISMDALAADDMSLYGYHLPTTPKLEAFAKQSYVFDNFFASSNWTPPSIASLISGLYPDTHGVNYLYAYFLEDDREKNLGQLLKNNGYQTAAIVANEMGLPLNMRISNSFSLAPILSARRVFLKEAIFDGLYRLKFYYRMCYTRNYKWLMELLAPLLSASRDEDLRLADDESPNWTPEPPFDPSLPILATLKQPNFIWSHIYPPHAPYMPAAPFKYKFATFKAFSTRKDFADFGRDPEYPSEQQDKVDQARLRYDEFILDTDSRVGDFLEKLKTMGRFDDSIIIVTADHGESFTKNKITHGGPFLHQPLIHVPLLVHLPGQTNGKRVPFFAGQVDLLPTVMDLLNLPIPKWTEGESLKAAMLEGRPTSRPKFSFYLELDSRFAPPSKGTVAVMQDGWKLVRHLATGKEELYHLAVDSKETSDLSSSNPGQATAMRDLIYARLKPAEQAQPYRN